MNCAGCKDDEAAGAPDGDPSHAANGADAVLEVLHMALREVMMEAGQKGTGLPRSGPADVSVPSASCKVGAVVGGNPTSFSFPQKAGTVKKTLCTQLEANGEEAGVTVADDAPMRRTEANFTEYVLERMLFGVMQEVVAGETEDWDA